MIVAQPEVSVGCSGAFCVQPYGRPSTYTSAPLIVRFCVSVTLNFAVIGECRPGLGEKKMPEMFRRSGGLTFETGVELPPPPPPPLEPPTTAVGSEIAEVDPLALRAVTSTRIVCPVSEERTP